MEVKAFLLLSILVVSISAVKVDPDSAAEQNYRYHSEKNEESFNPGHTQHGGWHKPEDSSNIGIAGGNQWKVNDYPSYLGSQSQYQPSQLDGQSTSYIQSSQGVSSHHAILSAGKVVDPSQGQYSPVSSLNHGGDLVVGQGSVQRPASTANQFQSNFGQESTYVQQPQKKIQPSIANKQYNPSEYVQFSAQQPGARPSFPQQQKPVVKNTHSVQAPQKAQPQPQPVYNPYKVNPSNSKAQPPRVPGPVYKGPPSTVPKNVGVGIGTYRPGPPQQYHQNLRRKQVPSNQARVGTVPENLRRGSSNPGVKFTQPPSRGQISRIYAGP